MDLDGKRVVLAGPMRGMPGFGHGAFDMAEKAIVRRWHPVGVFNPADNDRHAHGFDGWDCHGFEDLDALGFDVAAAQADCLRAIDQADVLVLLPGWDRSGGAKAEHDYGVERGVEVVTWADLWQAATPPVPSQGGESNG